VIRFNILSDLTTDLNANHAIRQSCIGDR